MALSMPWLVFDRLAPHVGGPSAALLAASLVKYLTGAPPTFPREE